MEFYKTSYEPESNDSSNTNISEDEHEVPVESPVKLKVKAYFKHSEVFTDFDHQIMLYKIAKTSANFTDILAMNSRIQSIDTIAYILHKHYIDKLDFNQLNRVLKRGRCFTTRIVHRFIISACHVLENENKIERACEKVAKIKKLIQLGHSFSDIRALVDVNEELIGYQAMLLGK
jgi:hypothetical protein